MFETGLELEAGEDARRVRYGELYRGITTILELEEDWISAMATVVCELHHAFDYYEWSGFYRRIGPKVLAVGPYQGPHGCLRIDFDRGVCGAAARSNETQFVADVSRFPGYIACSSATKSEVVVPCSDEHGCVFAVLDIDSDSLDAFTQVDVEGLEKICTWLGLKYGEAQTKGRSWAQAAGSESMS